MSDLDARRYDRIAVTGRFQPFHSDHLGLLLHALSIAERTLVCITNPDARSLQPLAASKHRHLAASNPFSYFERMRMITAALEAAGLAAERYDIVPFPLDASSVWPAYVPRGTPQLVRVYSEWEREKTRRLEAANYPVLMLEGNRQSRISASEIRAAMAAGEPWAHWVPQGTRDMLEALGDAELRHRCTAVRQVADSQ